MTVPTIGGALNGTAACPWGVTSARSPCAGGMVARYLRKFFRSFLICSSACSRVKPLGGGRCWSFSLIASPGGSATTTCGRAPELVLAGVLTFPRSLAIAVGSRSTSSPPFCSVVCAVAAFRSTLTCEPDVAPSIATASATSSSTAAAPSAIRPFPATRSRTSRRLRAAELRREGREQWRVELLHKCLPALRVKLPVERPPGTIALVVRRQAPVRPPKQGKRRDRRQDHPRPIPRRCPRPSDPTRPARPPD